MRRLCDSKIGIASGKTEFLHKKALSNPPNYGIVNESAGDDDWVPCGAML